jgi:hypothetical protein
VPYNSVYWSFQIPRKSSIAGLSAGYFPWVLDLPSLTNAPVVLLGSEETVHEDDGCMLEARSYIFRFVEVVSQWQLRR